MVFKKIVLLSVTIGYRSSCGGYEDGCTYFKLYMAQKIPASILFIIRWNCLKKNTRDLNIEPIIQSKF